MRLLEVKGMEIMLIASENVKLDDVFVTITQNGIIVVGNVVKITRSIQGDKLFIAVAELMTNDVLNYSFNIGALLHVLRVKQSK